MASLAEKIKRRVAESVAKDFEDEIEEMRKNFQALLEEVRKMNKTLEEIRDLLKGGRR